MAERLGRVEIFNGIKTVSRTQIRCECGEELVCQYNTNTCECGREYNMSGQQLASRSQWGQETGEHPVDVARQMDEETW